MNNKVKIITAVVGLIVVGLGVSLTQTKTIDIQEPIVPVVVEETIDIEVEEVEEVEEIEEIDIEIEEEVEPTLEEIGKSDTIEVVESTPVVEPTPVTETTPIAEPTAVEEATIEAVLALEEQATYEPAPQAQAEAEAEAPASSGQTYTTVFEGVSYTVTQEQMDRAWNGRGHSSTDGIPADVFSQIKNAGLTIGTDGLTYEEGIAQRNDMSLVSDNTIVWK